MKYNLTLLFILLCSVLYAQQRLPKGATFPTATQDTTLTKIAVLKSNNDLNNWLDLDWVKTFVLEDAITTESDPKGVKQIAFSGTTNKTLTVTLNDDSTVTGTFADINTDNYVTTATFNSTDGILTLIRQNGNITVDLDGRYLTSFTETDPTVPTHVKNITTTNISNWNAAEKNVNADWNATSGDAQILNKPTFVATEADGSTTNELQNLSLGTTTSTTQPVNISDGTGVTLPAATAIKAGLMTANDKAKIDNLKQLQGSTTIDIVNDTVKVKDNTITQQQIALQGYKEYPTPSGGYTTYIGDYDASNTATFILINEDQEHILASKKLSVVGDVSANKFIRYKGTSSQFLKADGSVDSNEYLTTADKWTESEIVDVIDASLRGSATIEKLSLNDFGKYRYYFEIIDNSIGYNHIDATVEADINQGKTAFSWGDHRNYEANQHLGAHYVSGGLEDPSFFGSGKLKLQMLRGTNIDNSSTWYDALWLSSYAGTDIRRSNALLFSKSGAARAGFVQQDYNATSWGAFNEFWHSGNFTPANYIPLSDKGANNGVATLGNDGKIPNNQIPDRFSADFLKSRNVATYDANSVNDGIFVSSYNTNSWLQNRAFGGYGGFISFDGSSGATDNNKLEIQYDIAHGTTDSGRIAYRTMNSTGHGTWREFWTSANFDPATKENTFSKNTAFNKNFGTATGTVAQGNDSRINNGQTAFDWGDHRSLYPLRGLLGGDINSIRIKDTRSTNPLPTTDLKSGAFFDFKRTTDIGINDPSAAIWAGTITVVPYTDDSGNNNSAFRLSQSNDNLFLQNYNAGAWGASRKLWHSGNFDPATKANASHTHSNYLGISAKAADANLLDGFNSSQTATASTAAIRDASGKLVASDFVLSSDIRLKENITPHEIIPINYELYNYNFKSDAEKRKRTGVIAQELEENHPQFVTTDKEGMKSVSYTDLLLAKIAELEARIKILEDEK